MSRVCLVLAWSRQDRTVAGFVRREVEAALGDGAVEVLLGGTALLARLAAGDVDVVIIDGRLGWTAVPGVVAGVRGRAPRACVLVLFDRPPVRAIMAAVRAGAADCVPRQAGALRRALRWCLAHAGDSDVEPDPERRWREWFELAPVGLCAWSPDGQILAVNRQALAMLGCQGDELAGRTPGSVPVNPDEFAGVHREALARDGAVTREFGVGRDDGPRRWVRLTARALRNGEGVARFVLARCDDVTEDRQQLAALQAALAEREVLLREVHHRVKNNLQIISSLLNLRLQTPSDPAARDLLRESQLRIKAIALVHQRLYSSASFARIDLEDYVCSLVANVRDAYAPLNPPVEVSLDVARVSVCMEHGIRLGLILTELVANAFKHAFVGRRAGCVRIGIRPVDDQRLEARVEDDGVGLPEDLARRSANSLGLALVRNFVEQLRGGLSFESQPGAGTRFRFVFLRERSDHSGGPA